MKIKSNKISDIRQFYLKELSETYKSQESTVLLDLIFAEIIGISRTDRILDPQKRVTESEILKIHFAVKDLMNHKPIQYILKKAEFYGLNFFVDENVLIPRPETEELVEWVLLEMPDHSAVANILDIGTGSGCIAISIKKYVTNSNVWAMDVSQAALAFAAKNALLNNVEIHFFLHDILEKERPGSLPLFDLIVSNPPYVRNSEKLFMQKNVLNFEPSLALFVEDEDPLRFYSEITAFSINHLKPGGKLFLEINEALGDETSRLIKSAGFSDIILKKDINGKNRMMRAIKPYK